MGFMEDQVRRGFVVGCVVVAGFTIISVVSWLLSQ